MKAVVYQEPYKVTVENMLDPEIEAPNHAIVRITTTNICGSDLHMYARFQNGMLIERWGSSDEMGIMQQIGAANGQGEGQDKGLVDKVKDRLSGR